MGSQWQRPSDYARANGFDRRYVWRLVDKGALEVRRVPGKAKGKRGAGVRVRDRDPRRREP